MSHAPEPEVERFNLLKLVKLIYYIEKDGNAKILKKQDDNVRVLITDILKKPRLDNIKTEYTEKVNMVIALKTYFKSKITSIRCGVQNFKNRSNE